MRAVFVRAGDDVCGRETIQRGKASTVGVELEHRATAAATAILGRSIQSAVRQNQFGIRTGAVAIGPNCAGCDAKRMQDGKTRAIGVDFEYRAVTSAAALGRSSIQRAARQQQTALRKCAVAIAEKQTRNGWKIEKIRESGSIGIDRKN